ncbi:DUF1592 domain-containing protein [bacterium]|nr:DUF1592 domain-containing protein [bacterium]
MFLSNKSPSSLLVIAWALICLAAASTIGIAATPEGVSPERPATQPTSADQKPSLFDLKQTGYQRSRFQGLANGDTNAISEDHLPTADLEGFKKKIKPLLEQHCVDCHGPDGAEGNIQIDALDPDLLQGKDTEWWADVFAAVTKGEMPPPDASELEEADRRVIVDWLSSELHAASLLRRKSGSHSGFRRLTRYEYNYALQDLLGLPWDFAKDLPPEPHSEEGFENSSALLHLSVSQFETYHRLARTALRRATVLGEQPPTVHWGISMHDAAERDWPKQAKQIEQTQKKYKDDPAKLEAELAKLEESFRQPHSSPYYKQLNTGRTIPASWSYPGAKYAFAPVEQLPPFPAEYDCVAILPRDREGLFLELGNQLPDEGTMRVTVRASRLNPEKPGNPTLQLLFGWQASNEGRALLRVGDADKEITATPDNPQIVQWDVPLGEIYPRNSVRKTSPLGATPSPSEYIRLLNSSLSAGDIQIDFVTVEAPVYDQWPPKSHRTIFFDSKHSQDEQAYAREILTSFMSKAWRRPITEEELDRKMKLFAAMRPECNSFEDTIVEVLATVLSSPKFLYVAQRSDSQSQEGSTSIDSYELATRLSLFLWCSIPDEELSVLAKSGELTKPEVLASQVDRMLADPRSERLSKHFVHQWLNLELLEFVNFKQRVKHFDPLLKEAMQQEPVAMFDEMLHHNASVLDFIHADYAMVNQRLAQHYGLKDVYGNDFRRVSLDGNFRRGGLLTQAGMLAMNSDWPDSHPLKRAIWLLERMLDDPPPPPPPAVPQIDLADPEIAKMTLKERIENHRNQAACKSCHAKIDPWGIAFENFDALGQWRDEIRGKPVDATSELFNHQKLDGMEGLKRFLLESRQDQFVQAMVRKLATYALGRPLGFEDRAEIDAITAKVRQEGDGLKTTMQAIVQSDLFQSN